MELGTEREAGIPGVQEEWEGIPSREEHVPRCIKVSEPGESVWQEGRQEGRAGIGRLYRPANRHLSALVPIRLMVARKHGPLDSCLLQ